MKDFLKFVTASCLGVFLSIFLLFLFVVIIGVSSGGGKQSLSNNTILDLDLSGAIPEQSHNVEVSLFEQSSDSPLGIHRLVRIISEASKDPKISGAIIKNRIQGGGAVTAQLLRSAIDRFRSEGKFVWTYSDYLNQSSYYLASVSDSIFLNPNGSIDIRGFAMTGMFYKKAADQLGIKLHTFYHGNYKGASEPYRREDFSEDNRYQLTEYLSDLKGVYFNQIAESREMEFSDINQIADGFKSINADSALQLGLADELVFESDFFDIVKSRIGIGDDESLQTISLQEYALHVDPSENKSDHKIAIIYSEGVINDSGDVKGEITVDRYQRTFDEIIKDENIEAVVLRVNSPGGSAFESDVFLHEIDKLKRAGKFVAVSMGNYAASGGYYISCHADTIVANPLSLTGSIGVVSVIPEYTDLLSEKLGITFDKVKTNEHAGENVNHLSDKMKQFYQNGADAVYDKFVNHISEGRNMTYEEVDAVANGRVWSGMDAKEVGLVDELGDLNETVDIVANRLGLDDFQLLHYPRIEVEPWEELLRQFSNEVPTGVGVSHEVELLNSPLLKWFDQTKQLVDGKPKMIFPFQLEL